MKKFTMWVDDDDADIISKCAFSVRSSTLEELKSDVTLGYCLCPALKVLKCTGEIRLERIRASSFEVDYSSLHVLELCYDGSVADINRWLDRLSSMIENMQVKPWSSTTVALTTVQIKSACDQRQSNAFQSTDWS